VEDPCDHRVVCRPRDHCHGRQRIKGFSVVTPLREVMLGQTAPRGSIGAAFALVTTGFNASAAVAPVLMV
jgi:hypothetical protein